MIDPQLWQDLVIFVTELEKNSAGNGKRASEQANKRVTDLKVANCSAYNSAQKEYRTPISGDVQRAAEFLNLTMP